MENITNEMKNTAVSDDELHAVSGGAVFLDTSESEVRFKAADGSVCPKCGHDIGTLKHKTVMTQSQTLICEKCGGRIAGILIHNQVKEV